MNFLGQKFVKFQDWSSDDGSIQTKIRTSSNAVMEGVRRVFDKGSDRIRSMKQPIISFRSMGNKKPTKQKELSSRKTVLNPQGQFLQTWNKLFLLSCAIALAVDPLFFYTPYINSQNRLKLDETLVKIACILRTLIDAFYVIHMVFQFRTAFIAPPSRVFGRGELIEDSWTIAKRYLYKHFIIDVLAILPLPQAVIIIFNSKSKDNVSKVIKDLLKFMIFGQYVPRIIRMVPLFSEVTRTSGILTKSAGAGATLNLFLYMLASHAVGAFWYLFSIEQVDWCHTNKNCGIFIDAYDPRVVNMEPRDFLNKFFYCFWWGLRNLSSLGQNLKTSTDVWENLFAVAIAIGGLILFALLIGNMQKYLQSTGVRVEEMRVKRQDAEQWMSHRMLPMNLRERIRKYQQYKWQATRGVDEEMLISNLPKDLKREIKRHLCLDLLKRVPMFEKMDEQLLDAMCDRLKSALYTDKSYIVREGDPAEEMLFIIRGNLESTTTNGGRTGFFNAVHLKAGDFCGDALLTWALDPQSSFHLPISTRTVQALTEVEAFALTANDLKFVASQFRRLQSKQFVHNFKFYSVQWQTWAASFIQAAWRRHCKRKLVKSLREAEGKLQDALATESGTTPSLGATLYASRFAANALRNLRNNASKNPIIPQRLPPLFPQKPAEPLITVDDS